ncbi:hypothetical protein CCUS01_01068 [Colletotrichum cuscutae]|uniref:Enoyl reductase (ER) domain-containing protein n=1 Tax=Colletotrichum cuscutae TaxID=1209917 RepID=A0AAI9UWS0_9PEZI|nr:hypothetical protein CCUS01_01068 [Colletotrichum cuscutae]
MTAERRTWRTLSNPVAETKTSAALFVGNAGQVTTRRDLPPVTARDDEILIDVLYSGVNPEDLKIVHFTNYRNSVPGTDFCGKVLDCPALVESGFKVGDIVAGQTVAQGEYSKEYGAHKPRISTPKLGLFRVPENMARPDAAAITTVSHTASDALYNNFQLPLPGSSTDVFEGTLVVWGGGTAVGLFAIQLARASRITNIITTASLSRHDLLRGLGATECFDYKDSDVSDKVRQAVINTGHSRVWGFETAGSPESSQLLLGALTNIDADVRFSWVNATEPGKAANIWAALDWVVKNYGKGFELPVVRVFEGTGEKALEEMETVSKQGAFGKLVLKHPLR